MLLRDETNSISARAYIARSRKLRIAGTGALCSLVLLSILAAFPISNNNDNAEATYVPATTTLSIVSSKDTASVDITPTSASGTFATSAAADQAEFTVTTDNLTGYSLNILGTDTSGQLVNTATGDTLDSITTDVSESTFRTGAAATYDNKWGYRLTVNGTTGANFLAAPTTSSKTIYTTSAPNTTADSYTLGVGARVDYSKPVGTYTNTFVLTAVANSISYQINYLDADGTTQLLPSDAESNISASSIELNSTAPTKSGYNFLGWCDGTLSSDGESCTGTTYQPGDTYTFASLPSTGTVTANLYAVWEAAGAFIQNLDPTLCTSTPRTVIDKRDGEEYLVQRLADGNCWLLDNLRLDISDPAVQAKLNSTTTNATDTVLGYLKNGGGSGQYPANGVSSNWTSSSQNTGELPYIATGYINTTVTNYGIGSGKVGVYYNYCAASAGSYCYSTSSSSGNAQYDICPAGWRMPTGGSSGDYQALYTAYSSNFANFMAALSVSLSGNFYSGAVNNHGFNARVWSSTRNSNSYMHDLDARTSQVYPQSTGDRPTGFSVRCIMKGSTMQSFTIQAANAMATNASLTLEDERDGQLYTVKKLADGNVWMTRNLAIGCNGTGSTYGSGYAQKTLTSADSNVNSSFSTSTTSLTTGLSYDDAYQNCNATYGAYYNYAAASAGTIIGSSNTSSQVYDICPKGWRLPNSTEFAGIKSYSANFNLVKGAFYENAAYSSSTVNTHGFWWSSDVMDSTNRGTLVNYNGTLSAPLTRDRSRYGFYIRCIKDSGVEMQNITYADLDQYIPNAGDSITLTDNRDGQKYRVFKAKDGNIWMADNLNLGATTLTQDLTSSNTNVSSTVPAATFNSWKKTSGTTSYTSGEYIPVSDVDSTSKTLYGTLYNYYAASAGTISGSSNTSNATSDICPAGWRLPTGGASGEFQALYSNYGSSASMRNPVASGGAAFALAGNFQTTATNKNSLARYWSSTATGNSMYALGGDSSSFNATSGNNDRGLGNSVRCILNDPNILSSVHYMQDITPQVIAKASNGDTATMVDARDGQEYTVAKINGKVWMTKSLAIGCNGTGSTYGNIITPTILTSADSNVASITSTTSSSLTLGNDNNNPRMECDSTYGAWYNYAAASAGTITGGSNATVDTYSICPRGWRLPTYAEQSGITSASNTAIYGPVAGGIYYNGLLQLTTIDGYWTATAYSGTNRYAMGWSMGNTTMGIGDNQRYQGMYVRCIAN